jgi:DNA polymerase-3 subunit delta'
MRSDFISLGQFTGNADIADVLRRGRFPTASIFEGPEGVGKKTLAISLASVHSCDNPNDDDICGQCSSCTKISSNNHPDVRIIDLEWLKIYLKSKGKRANPQVIPIDAMRELIREVQFRPHQAEQRFFIIDNAHKLNEAASNSILKTLEEPPADVYIILVTSFPAMLLPTIRSRCSHYRFGPLSRENVAHHLKLGNCEEKETELRAAFSGGSIGKASDLNLEETLERRDMALEVLQAWLQARRFSAIFKHTESPSFRSILANRDLTLSLLDALRGVVEDAYYLLVETPSRLVSIDKVDNIRALASQLRLSQTQNLLQHIQLAKTEIEAYVSPRMCFETLWLNSLEDKCWETN